MLQNRRRPHWALLAFAVLTSSAVVGCAADSGIGDPCDPEQVPADGFNGDEAYLETSSVQCRTRVCMVYKLDGDPRLVSDGSTPTCAGADNCVTEQEIEDRIYCSCRCDAPAGSSLPTCNCGAGFTCEPVLELGGDGIRGSYCVREGT